METLKISDLVVRRGKFELGPVSMELPPAYHVLLGHNGAGKTTLMGALLGLIPRKSGNVGLAPRAAMSPKEAARQCGYAPQSLVFPRLVSVAQVLNYTAWLKCVPRKERGAAVDRVASDLGLEGVLGKRAASLSGGVQRRVAIAQAMVHQPSVLILDEPTSGLDPIQRVHLREILTELAKTRIVLVSTHLVEDVAGQAGSVAVLSTGRMVFSGTVPELEARGDAEAPGQSPLERGFWTLMEEHGTLKTE